MNEAVINYEVIEEEHNYAFKNGEYVEVKQEEVEQKPENFLENEIKKEPIDFFQDVKPESKESDSRIQKVFDEIIERTCRLCHKRMPTNLLKLIETEDEKTVISEIYKVEGSLKNISPYVCVSHIKAIIKDNIDKLELASTTPSEQRLRSFITQNILMKDRQSRRQICQVCHMVKDSSQLFSICSKNTRIAIMIGCILRGTHSIDQAKSYIKNFSRNTCYSHREESIDMIFEHLGVSNIQEFLKCATFSMSDLLDIVKEIDANITVKQFISAFNALFLKKPKVLSSF
ncbi:unnamed protein product [Caenorhabditis nigoni]|uniref:Lin-15A/B-like domain-containing protein n=1 Tax=Caenorhabditis nigoni TaxID=1611254 RepID=A0A2G5TQF8_9PELO|nr:hypothetical protein B9Z55_021081 [Caenorhabditis nigoni]